VAATVVSAPFLNGGVKPAVSANLDIIVVEPIAQQVEDVDADRDDNTTAGLVFVENPSLGLVAHVALNVLVEIDVEQARFAKVRALQPVFQPIFLLAETLLMTHLHEGAGGFFEFLELLQLGQSADGRLFQKHRQFPPQRFRCRGRMQKMRGGHQHRIHPAFERIEHLPVIGENRRPERPGQLIRQIGDRISHPRHAHQVRLLPQKLLVHAGDTAGSDKGQAQRTSGGDCGG
jgi:hypothetical protein